MTRDESAFAGSAVVRHRVWDALVMTRSEFAAARITVGPLEEVDAHVGWAADEQGAGPHLILMRGTGEDASWLRHHLDWVLGG